RTPLNSILILAKLLAGNKNKNLTDKQIEHASVIHKSGSDLLMLINDILDISKIESGKLEFVFEKMNIETVANDINLLFKEFANEKQINFQVKVWENCYPEMVSDKLRLEQVIKNLISNALKFTDKNGQVSLDFRKATTEDCKTHNLHFEEDIIAISVTDSGIGIPVEKQKQVFEAFKQADNSTSRKYGGTGLGLTISREIVQILGGEIVLESTPGKGSTFTVFIPFFASCESTHDTPVKKVITQAETEKQENIKHESPLISTIVSKFPDDDFTDDRNFITPFDKVILILEKDITFLKTLIDYCHIFNYKAIASQNGETGILLAKNYQPHVIIVDHNLPDIDGGTLLKNIRSEQKLSHIPIHIISELKPTEGLINEFNITAYHHKPLNKKQLENVMNELQAPVNITKKETVVEHTFHESSLSGKTILMADDDLRNIYALTTLIENAGANLICAYDGKEAINKLEKNPHVDIVLMDVLMPVMNGVDAIAEIRKTAQFRNIPVLAVLSGSDAQEKEKCLDAGATDTLSRPLNNDQILNKIKFLLYQ
ncbi:MAG TPA: response regulator, partial [Bacteroidia bacterium]|nr:response regulator [Bacteroidia bacterium]